MVCGATRPRKLHARDISPLACPHRDQIYQLMPVARHTIVSAYASICVGFDLSAAPPAVVRPPSLVRPDTTKRHGLSILPAAGPTALPCSAM
jgi:hypothetical protein